MPGRDPRRRRRRRVPAGHDGPLPRLRLRTRRRPATPSSCTRRRAASGCCSPSSPTARGARVLGDRVHGGEGGARPGRGGRGGAAVDGDDLAARVRDLTGGDRGRRGVRRRRPRHLRRQPGQPAPPRHARALRRRERAGAAGRPAAAQPGRLGLPHPPDAAPLRRDPRGAHRPRRGRVRRGRRRAACRSGSGTATRSSRPRARTTTSRAAGRPARCCSSPRDRRPLMIEPRSRHSDGDRYAPCSRREGCSCDRRTAHAVPRPRRLHRAPASRASCSPPTAAGSSRRLHARRRRHALPHRAVGGRPRGRTGRPGR